MRLFFAKWLACLSAIGFSASAYSGHVEVTQRIYTPVSGTEVVIGQPEATKTVDLTPKTGSFTDYKMLNQITFGVDHTYPVYFPDSMQVRVKLHVEPYDASNTPTTDFYIYLDLNYNPFGTLAYTDKNVYRFLDAYKFDYTIDSIYIDGVSKDTLPEHLFIDGLIDAERYYDFSTISEDTIVLNDIDTFDLNCDTFIDELEISWPTTTGAEEYQLEWTFINDYEFTDSTFLDDADLEYDFKHNSTRITTTNEYYRIPVLFDHGYIVFRVRAIGRDDADPSQLIFGVWSLNDQGTVEDVASSYYHVTTPHEANKNWQASTTFAEEGKKKEVVSYFDGSLRNRQTVTRINSDNNTIVGETIYDHQGRPAITVLPVPVTPTDCEIEDSANVLMYYPLFNVDDTLNEYSRNDFDVDSDVCNTGAGIMDTASGSSNYYSPANNNLVGHQRYVPDANGYPFTQVEYTPDNTGRIRRQSGVGEDFQLGSGHETKYYYGQPNQIQLDRMFGSEVGDATHYKKNLVIDPNGQASVSYLDQEGRVIATSLAGDSTANLYAIDSEADAAKELTVDLFAKNADGISHLNSLNVSENGIEFSTQLLVPYSTTYTFDYDIAVDTLADACLAENICFSCVYDLTIKVIDECGVDLIETEDTLIENKVIGHFEMVDDTVVFNTECSSPTDFDYAKSVELVLPVGNYTIIKQLTVNNDAIDFYVDAYLDSTVNECFMTLHDFEALYLSQIDTSNCYISCEECLESLGERDEFVAQGKGSAFDYDREYAECQKLCPQDVSFCETAYQAMIMDMSPGGQYAHYIDAEGDIDPSGIKLSVLNPNNILPIHVTTPSSGTWRYPDVTLNGTDYNYYLDDQNNRSIIPLIENGANYIPAVADTSSTKVFQDSNGDYYTHPENLLNVSDFILNWQSGWGRSLVKYHPEYCYYETCISYEEPVNAADSYSSEEFDLLLLNTITFQDAIDNELIRVDHDTVVNPNNRLENWFVDNTSNGKPWDPFVVRTTEYGAYSTALLNKFNTYIASGSNTFSMIEIAAATVRCGNLINLAPTSTCYQFGRDFIIGGPSAFNDSIRDAEWNTLKNLYLSYKNIIKNNRADAIALNDCEAINDCIGNDDFNPAASGMYNGGFPSSPNYDQSQPCSIYNRNYYLTKVQRFPDPEDNSVSSMSANDIMYQQYLLTGQCPITNTVEDLLGALAGSDSLTADTVRLLNYPEYSAYYLAVNNYDPAFPITDFDYDFTGNVTVTGDSLVFFVTNPAGTIVGCTQYLIDNDSSFTNDWNDIEFFTGMQYTSGTSPNYYFTIYAAIPTPDSLQPYRFDTLTGKTCVNIATCNFQMECEASEFALDLQDLMTALATEGDLNGSVVDLQQSSYSPFTTPVIRAELGVPNDELDWDWDIATHSWLISDSTDATRRIRIYLRELDPPTFNLGNLDSITDFFGMTSTYQHYFTIYAHYGANNDTLQIDAGVLLEDDPDTTAISMGDCGLPDPALCNETGHQVKEDLEALLEDILLKKPFEEDINLYANSLFTPLLQSFLGDTTGITSSEYNHYTYGDTLHLDTLSFNLSASCLELWHQDEMEEPVLLIFDSLEILNPMTIIGEPDAEGNFHDFYFVGYYHYSGSEYFIDTIFGHTCMPLKNCSPCPEESTSSEFAMMSSLYSSSSTYDNLVDFSLIPLTDEETFDEIDSAAVANGEAFIDNTDELYTQYKNAIDSLNNANGWSPTDSLYITALTFQQYRKGGYQYIHNYYLPFIERYIYEIDEHSWLTDPKKFILVNGIANNVKVQYARYEKAEAKYNERADANGLDQHAIKPALDFYYEKRSEDIYQYISYLQNYPDSSGNPADDVDTWYGSSMMMMMSFEDSCDLLYGLYVDAYTDFEAYQDTNNTCFNYEIIAPFYSQIDFEDNNLCCSDTGLAVFNDYIETFTDTLQWCPGPMPYLSSCDSIIADDTTCLVLYYAYLDQLTAYNNSEWADSMNVLLDTTLYFSYEMFLKTGQCDCAEDYITYLDPYLDVPVDTSLADPISIDEFCSYDLSTKTYCSESYYIYLDTLTAYNLWNNDHTEWPDISPQSSGNFTAAKYCYCVEGYVAYLNAIMDGVVENTSAAEVLLSIDRFCSGKLTPECTPEAPITGTFISPVLTYVNPCVQYMTDVALMNAENAYNDYVDSIANSIRSRYIEHCLSAVENFTTNYIDKEYHFTLYYYDQAGNLVKTVPPEGVQLLNFTDPTDDTAILINNDRTYGTRSIFTSHLMDTRYEYNSLNQLVKQSMPDHDKMTIWETTLPNGLDSRLQGTEVTFTNESNGYMSGYITVGGINRGLLYRTSDGGATWKKVDYTAGTNIKKIFWVNDTLAYGIGSDGIAIKTVDGGQNWTMMNFYRSHLGVGEFNDLYFSNTTTGIFVGNSGKVIRTTDGGSTFSSTAYSGAHANDSIVTLSGNGATVRLAVIRKQYSDFGTYGKIYTSGNTGSTWTAYNIRDINYRDIQYVNGQLMYAGGYNGHFAERQNPSGTFNWYHKPSTVERNIIQIYFLNANEGISLQDSASGYGIIYRTSDAGITWEQLSEPGKYYKHFYAYKTGTVHKLIAVGHNGLASKILLQAGYPFGMIDLDKPNSSYDLKACWAYEFSDGKTWMIAASDSTDGDLWITKNGSDNNQSWTQSASLSGGIAHILMKQFISGSDTTLSGTIIRASDKKMRAAFRSSSGTFTIGTVTGHASGAEFSDQVHDEANSRNYFLDEFNRRIVYTALNGTSIPTAITYSTGTSPSTGFQGIDYNQNDTIYFAQTAGNIGYGVVNNSTSPITITWTNEVTTLSQPTQIRDMQYHSARTTYYAVGDGGAVYRDTASSYRRCLSNVYENLNAIKFYSYSTAYVVGDNGKVYSMNIDNVSNVTLTELTSPTTEDLTDIAISGNVVYITGKNGVLLYSPDITTTALTQLTVNFSGNLNGVSFKPSSSIACVVGDDSRMFMVSGSTVIPQKNIFLPAVRSVSFYDNEHGYLISDNFNLRYTDDAGASWQPILPSASIGTAYTTMNKIRATGINTSMAVGNNRTLYEVSGLVATLNTRSDFSTPTTDHLFDAWQHGNVKFVIKGNASNGYLYQKVGSGAWTLIVTYTGTPLRAMNGFSNGNLLLCGTNGKIVYFNDVTNTSTNWTAPTGTTTNTWNDIFFHDDLNGYVVGANGVVLRSKDFSLNSSGYHVFGSWDKMQTDDSLYNQTDTTLMTINSIAFGERFNGVMTGTYNGTPAGYHRRIHDETQLYSTYFWYDKLGRIVLSQNTKQFNKAPKAYSYTLYDELGRVVEAGEKRDYNSFSGSSSNSGESFSMIFGDTIANHYNPDVINDDSLQAWVYNTDGIRTEVTHSWYDDVDVNIGAGLPGYLSQTHLRKRIAHVTYEDTLDADTTTYDHATHYSYDIHGNVKTLLQDNKKLATEVPDLASQQFKRMDYSYDLISGNVHSVSYQKDSADVWHHAYEYDADNRITDVYTSNASTAIDEAHRVENSALWDKDARYEYYLHGPLARMETGDLQVQGTDYAYTLQGWIKGVNSNSLDTLRDIGKDGWRDNDNPNRNFAKDVYSYSLDYFAGDYDPIDNSVTGTDYFMADISGATAITDTRFDLFNGNIQSMYTTITNPTTREVLPMANSYIYDQLNRLLQARSFVRLHIPSNMWKDDDIGADTKYYNKFSYDANGNILTQQRHDDANAQIDDLTYRYAKNSDSRTVQNRLYHVDDAVSSGAFSDDIDDQGTFSSTLGTINSLNNYSYDEIGNLARDTQGGVDTIIWNVSGKVKQIVKGVKTIDIDFNAMGLRVAKHYRSNDSLMYSEYYVHDATGNVISIYKHTYDYDEEEASYKLVEQDIYGSGKVGIRNPELEMIAAVVDTSYYERELEMKNYFFSNHLGNIGTTITDLKIPKDWDADDTVDSYWADVITAVDYSPFGVELSNRKFSVSELAYGFNGQRKDNEVYGEGNSYTAEFWQYDPRLGRRWNIDRIFKSHRSCYDAFDNNPLIFIDPHGDDDIFSSTGEYLFSTATGREIRIANSGMTTEKLKENLKDINTNTQLLSSFSYSDKLENVGNLIMLKSVTMYYLKQSNIKLADKWNSFNLGTYTKDDENELAHYDRISNDIEIAVSTDGKIDAVYDNIDIFKSILVHEAKHQTDDNPSTLSHVTFVIAGAMQHSSWKKTPEYWKKSQAAYAVKLLNKYLGEFGNYEEVEKAINTINKLIEEGTNSFLSYDLETNTVKYNESSIGAVVVVGEKVDSKVDENKTVKNKKNKTDETISLKKKK